MVSPPILKDVNTMNFSGNMQRHIPEGKKKELETIYRNVAPAMPWLALIESILMEVNSYTWKLTEGDICDTQNEIAELLILSNQKTIGNIQ
jgi:hypothetical protein